MELFKNLGLRDDMLEGIAALGFSTPTPVQELVIPAALTGEKDLIALAQTGTGKTAAFGLPLLQLSNPDLKAVQALVLCPTRELCVQVASDLTDYCQFSKKYKVVAVYGGASIETQIKSIRAGAQIVVATPGRLVDLLSRKAVDLSKCERVVLDEADEMLDMGFKDSLDVILGAAVNRKTTWLFSATMSGAVRNIAKEYMTMPTELTLGTRNQANENIKHIYYVCRPDDKYAALKRIVDNHPGIYGLIFCRTKNDTKEIAEQMMRDGYNSDALHGDLSQADRDKAMGRFRDRTLQLLIATDVAARGIDVSDITHVIHYGLPDDAEVYTHRSGRTGRAGKKGVSISIISPKFESRIKEIERACRVSFEKQNIPTGAEVCENQLFHIIKNIHDQEVKQAEIEPFLPKIYEELADLSKEELIKRFASVEFNRFLKYYQGAIDINISKNSRPLRGDSGIVANPNFVRYFVNIGELDGVDKKTFLKVMTKNMGVPGSAIGQIDIKKAFMHFDVANEFAVLVKNELQMMSLHGRKVRVDNADRGGFAGGGGGGKPKFKEKEKRKKGIF